MVYRPLVNLPDEIDYRDRYKQDYVLQSPIMTFDNIAVKFMLANHVELLRKDPAPGEPRAFCPQRAQRLLWIKPALEDAGAELYFGYDSRQRRVDYNRRIAIVDFNYVVVIRMTGLDKASIITAYPMDTIPLAKARTNPVWNRNQCTWT